ncbi:MAG: ATP-dependent helicase [Candidatus Dadabacteria bacterium]|nr:ATP-dependent helicase [Candidatus Dadabacteria bacterium]
MKKITKFAYSSSYSYSYNIERCLLEYSDLREAEKWFGIAESNLNAEDMKLLVSEVRQSLLSFSQSNKDRLDKLFAVSDNKYIAALRTEFREYETRRKREQEEERIKQERIEAEKKRIEREEEEARRKREQEEAERRERERIERENALAEIRKCFKDKFLKADGLYKSKFSGLLSNDEYQREKRSFVQSWFEENSAKKKSQPDKEQIAAIASTNDNVLLKARAGSGKTTVATARTRFLIEHCGVNVNDVMLLAFNKKAATEINNRMNKNYGFTGFRGARTFHSLAYQLVQPSKTPLFDEKEGGVSTKEQSKFVQGIVNDVKNPVFLYNMYRLFRKEMKELEDIGEFLSKEEYFAHRRNYRQVTLNGDSVKSLGEKYIGDFLFEHGIDHRYEKVWFWGSRNYRPDFSIFTNSKPPNIVIEHWGIDENDPHQRVPEHWNVTWQDYKKEMNDKREFWQSGKRKEDSRLVETSVVDLENGRESFEDILKERLTNAGLQVTKLDEKDLYEKLDKVYIARLTERFLQFIQKAKKQRLSSTDLIKSIEDINPSNERVKVFCAMANAVYQKYESKLLENNLMDFDDLLQGAMEKVVETQGDCEVRMTDNLPVKLNQIKYLMIDEYQDFSPLFVDLIDAIRKYNPDLRVFCVGDDWQAINAFAGSDLKFFKDFEKYMGDSQHLSLLTNYRSARRIVETSNNFMTGKGDPSRSYKNEVGEIYKCYTDKVRIEQRKEPEYEDDRKFDERFKTIITTKEKIKDMDPGLLIGKTLKACHSILTDEANRSKTFAVMTRKRQLNFYYKTPKDFESKLKEVCKDSSIYKDFDKRVKVGTTHSFKGLESDVVIMLFVNNGDYPLIHPDNELFEIFGQTPADALSEEQRLFYVGMTRAKEKLYILCEQEIESEFVSGMRLEEYMVLSGDIL